MKKIPLDIARHLFTYNPKSGELIWKNCSKPWRNGSAAGFINHHICGHKRMIVRIPGNGDHKIARIAWAMFTGSDPFPLQVDHIDQNPLNNRIENLRLANQAENIRNRSVLPNNIAGLKGVSLKKPGKYQARITKNYKTFHLGYFATKDEAYNAYKNACKILHQQFASY